MSYTPFDLPEVVKQGALITATFDYDGDEQRIRKTTPDEETLYFGDLYERVTDFGQSFNKDRSRRRPWSRQTSDIKSASRSARREQRQLCFLWKTRQGS